MNRTIHIVSFTVPWPANYGGAIDIYYKLKALHECGVRIHLHCFMYDREPAPELETLCEKVYYYRRRTGLCANVTYLPYNVYSRKDETLVHNLLQDGHPILFEGLHSCYYMGDKRLENRFRIFRECNIEHDYYREIARAERNPVRKLFHAVEAIRFALYEKTAAAADLIIAVSESDAAYLRRTFPRHRVEFVPCFHGNKEITAQAGQSDCLLYHGKLSVKENEKAALFLIRHVFNRMPCRCVIAGMNPSAALLKAAAGSPNITVEANPAVERIEKLIREAQVNTLVTFQGTGLKLKLLNSLFSGRHALVNSLMLTGSGLESLCHVADTPEAMRRLCLELLSTPFDDSDVEARKTRLLPAFSDKYQAERLVEMIFPTIP
ncbi:MAG: glycosyltransferase family 1 protein [Tannerella sp.]|jgi:hypothetical protein|nr:glycosyltransferase family 1 protein [Tannerella sp.]